MTESLFLISPLPESLTWLVLHHTAIGLALVALGLLLLVVAFTILILYRSHSSDTDPKTIILHPPREILAMPSRTETVSMGAHSVQGERPYQQDAYIFADESLAKGMGRLAVVCDGMGGFESGEIASRYCVDTIFKGYYELAETSDCCQLLRALAEMADKEVSELTKEDGTPLKSGTTLVAIVVKNDKAHWVSVGDSRIYYIKPGQITQITRDHNLRLVLQKQCDEGLMSQQDVDSDPQGDALISFVGKGRDTLIDVGSFDFKPSEGEMLLLCSDGIYKYISSKEIMDIATANCHDMQTAAQVLVSSAMEKPARHDNITALMIGK